MRQTGWLSGDGRRGVKNDPLNISRTYRNHWHLRCFFASVHIVGRTTLALRTSEFLEFQSTSSASCTTGLRVLQSSQKDVFRVVLNSGHVEPVSSNNNTPNTLNPQFC